MLHGHDHSIFLHLPQVSGALPGREVLFRRSRPRGYCRTITSQPADVAP
jgi:hypothetical protein